MKKCSGYFSASTIIAAPCEVHPSTGSPRLPVGFPKWEMLASRLTAGVWPVRSRLNLFVSAAFGKRVILRTLSDRDRDGCNRHSLTQRSFVAAEFATSSSLSSGTFSSTTSFRRCCSGRIFSAEFSTNIFEFQRIGINSRSVFAHRPSRRV